ncbi:MAG: flagellar basal body rod protein FlgC [Limnochordia bacterium]|jgi:flagellar basal-body rod protein FlgC|nr:flagellar basal body rod protein FlgC [Limnochordia bacterium]MDD2629374.1 flagellar basal body rod protein FlgC [Limnochordia bacterium]MDD4518660.1 flagellar basal body rod protein FlgC [Limnochordia bacterium]
MGFFSSFDVSASALTAERLRMDVISANVANAQSTRTETGDVYRRRLVVYRPASYAPSFAQILAGLQGDKAAVSGVRVDKIVEDNSDFRRVYEPGHPHADEQGYVTYPNVDVIREMVDMIGAVRAYEANAAVIQAGKTMAQSALQIGR